VTPDLEFEREALDHGLVVGLDEVGRGALAGPVSVGAVLLESDNDFPEGLADSKQLRAGQRDALVGPLRTWALAISVGSASADEIDAWGLRTALAVAANRAIAGLGRRPASALVDGNVNLLQPSPTLNWSELPVPALAFADLPVRLVVRGDQRCASIAAASVLAKVHRDELMVRYGRDDTRYGWSSNKGYGARQHLEALRLFGPTSLHRRSWALPTRSA